LTVADAQAFRMTANIPSGTEAAADALFKELSVGRVR